MKSQKIKEYLKKNQQYYYDNFGIQFIGLFGSFARDEASDQSDIDILYKIEQNKKLSIFKYLKMNKELEEFFHRKIDLVRDETLKPHIRSSIYKDLSYV